MTEPVAEILKKRGFRKKGRTFQASRPGIMLTVDLQSSRGSSRDSLKITCNLAIVVEQLADRRISGGGDAHWRRRIGEFLAEPRDFWWHCSSDEEARCAGREIADLLEERALSSMDALASTAALAALWASGLSPGLTERQRVENLARLTAME